MELLFDTHAYDVTTYPDHHFDTLLIFGTILDEFETAKVGILNLGQLGKTGFLRRTYFRQQFHALFLVSKLNGRLHHSTGIVLKRNLGHLASNEGHHLVHEFFGILRSVGFDAQLVPQQLRLTHRVGVAAVRLSFRSFLSFQGTAGEFGRIFIC